MARKQSTFEQIPILRERYYEALSGKESLIQVINEAEIPEHVYNSNAIENSTLTLEETENILLEIELERFASAREINEAKNLARVATYIEGKSVSEKLSLELMRLLHKMLLSNINDDIAGRFRKEDEWVRVGSYIAPNPKEVEPLLTKLLASYAGDTTSHIVTRLARFHLEFERTHPFCDGNGRIGRVLNNYILLREGYVPINIAFANRERYYTAFKMYDTGKGDAKIMEEIIGRALTESYYKRLAYMEGKKIIRLKEYAQLPEINDSPSNLLNKAERQTIEAFQEKGVWKIGIEKD